MKKSSKTEKPQTQDLVRLSISIESDLLSKMSGFMQQSGHSNRSEFIRDLIRDRLVDEEWKEEGEVLGTITLVYDHHARELSEKLIELQHEDHHLILATTHVHLDKHLCAEVIIAKGDSKKIRAITEAIRKQRGVLHVSLSTSTTGQTLHSQADHPE